MQGKPHIPERPPGRLPTTSVTNEIARAVNGLYDLPPFGQVNEPVAVPLARPQMIGITNKSGENVPQFGVLGLDAPTFSPEDTDPLGFQIDGVLPTTEDHAGGHFAIVVQGLAATGSSEGEFGYAVVSGVVKAWVNVTNEDHQFADVKDGDVTQLESGDTGSARIIAKDAGTGKKLCVVLLGSSPPPVIRGIVVCEGPNGEPDFTDNQYWVAFARPANTESDGPHAKVAWEKIPDGKIVAATNWFENNCGTHNVRPQTEVVLWKERSGGQTRYWMITADEGTCRSEPCEPSGSSSSSSSISSESSSGSSSSSSSGELRCVYRWNCQYDCETQQWGPVTFVGSNCMAPPDQVGQWIPTATPCLYTYWGVGDPCDQPEDPDCPAEPPPAPAPPDFVPDCCDSSSSEPPSSEPPSSEPPEPSGSEKSSAIVPASWSKGGYAALYVTESPNVRFEDVVVATIKQKDTTLILDSKFVEVCEPGSLEAVGATTDVPALVGVRIDGSRLHVAFDKQRPSKQVRLVVKISAIRRGFAGVRFGDRTRAEFEANERFLGMARPKQ